MFTTVLKNITKKRKWSKLKAFIPSYYLNNFFRLMLWILNFLYRGDKFYCPICKHNFRKFISNKMCPNCGSMRTHRALFMYLEQETSIFFTYKIKLLHFAPEFSLERVFNQCNNINYITGDINSIRAKEKIDITDISYPANYFDVIISVHVLEHIDNDIKAIKELFRVQKNTGYSLHLVPADRNLLKTFENPLINNDKLRRKYYGHYDHKRRYGSDFANRLEENGFKVTKIQISEILSDALIYKCCIFKNQEIFLCKK